MANIAQSVNVISPLITTPSGLVKQTTWWPLLLFSKHMRGWNIATHISSPAYDGATEPKWQQAVTESPWLDVSATVNENGRVSLVVVNVHLTENSVVDLKGIQATSEAKIKVYSITGDTWDVINTSDRNSVGIREHEWDGEGKFEFPRMSMTMLQWQS